MAVSVLLLDFFCQASLPPASKCRLYLVNRDALFSYHDASEAFLHGLLSLFVSSHYKNTPNDLMLMADAPAHLLFVLLPPVDEHTDTVPDIYCAIQVRRSRRALLWVRLVSGPDSPVLSWPRASYLWAAPVRELFLWSRVMRARELVLLVCRSPLKVPSLGRQFSRHSGGV